MRHETIRHRPAIGERALGFRQVQFLAYVQRELETSGIAPSYDMIDRELDLGGRHKVHKLVKSMERRGYLSRVGKGRVRRIRLSQGEQSRSRV